MATPVTDVPKLRTIRLAARRLASAIDAEAAIAQSK
jgi:hypothetical protein